MSFSPLRTILAQKFVRLALTCALSMAGVQTVVHLFKCSRANKDNACRAARSCQASVQNPVFSFAIALRRARRASLMSTGSSISTNSYVNDLRKWSLAPAPLALTNGMTYMSFQRRAVNGARIGSKKTPTHFSVHHANRKYMFLPFGIPSNCNLCCNKIPSNEKEEVVFWPVA